MKYDEFNEEEAKMNIQNISNIDLALSELIKNNYAKIVASSPVNPTIKKNDEWRTETCWDTDYKELKK